MEIQVYRFIGKGPMLMCNMHSTLRGLPTWKLGSKPNTGDIEKIAEGMTYRGDTAEETWPRGPLTFPAQAYRSSLEKGCTGKKFGKVSPLGLVKATIFPAEEYAALVDSHGKPLTKVEPHVTTGVNRSTKARVNVVRALVREWRADVPFEVDRENAPSNYEEYLEKVLELWNRAGGVIGVGAWRPFCGGRFGKYTVERVK